jgi:hypothetical protein
LHTEEEARAELDSLARRYATLRRVYRLYGAEDRVENLHLADEGHDYVFSKRAGAYAFLANHLALSLDAVTGPDGSVDERDVVLEAREALHVFDAAHPLRAHAVTSNDAVRW